MNGLCGFLAFAIEIKSLSLIDCNLSVTEQQKEIVQFWKSLSKSDQKAYINQNDSVKNNLQRWKLPSNRTNIASKSSHYTKYQLKLNTSECNEINLSSENDKSILPSSESIQDIIITHSSSNDSLSPVDTQITTTTIKEYIEPIKRSIALNLMKTSSIIPENDRFLLNTFPQVDFKLVNENIRRRQQSLLEFANFPSNDSCDGDFQNDNISCNSFTSSKYNNNNDLLNKISKKDMDSLSKIRPSMISRKIVTDSKFKDIEMEKQINFVSIPSRFKGVKHTSRFTWYDLTQCSY